LYITVFFALKSKTNKDTQAQHYREQQRQ